MDGIYDITECGGELPFHSFDHMRRVPSVGLIYVVRCKSSGPVSGCEDGQRAPEGLTGRRTMPIIGTNSLSFNIYQRSGAG